MSFLGLQTPKNARDHPIIVWHPWRLFLAIFFATKMGSKVQKVMGNPNPQGSSKISWVWAYLAGQHTVSCRVSIVVLLNTIQLRHPSVTFVAVTFFDQSQMKRLYKYIHMIYITYFKWNPKNSHQPDIFSDSMFLSSVSPLSLHRRKTKKTCFPECHVAMFKIRSVKTNWRRPLQPKVSCVSGAGSRCGYNDARYCSCSCMF